MEASTLWLAFVIIFTRLNISNTSVNTSRDPSVKSTAQSSSYSLSSTSDKAVDGCTSQRYSSGCCIHTSTSNSITEAWWQIDLDNQTVIDYITIYYRNEGSTEQKTRFGGYNIYLSNTTDTYSLCYQDTTSSLTSVDLNPTITSCTGSTRYLTIYIDRRTRAYNWYSSTPIMELCEVQVYGCPQGTFGNGNCDLNCDSTCVNSLCDPTTGECTYCEAGSYKLDLVCSPCPTNCNTQTCDVDTGGCTACVAGFYGSHCDLLCPVNCKNNICVQEIGQCEACVAGYYGSRCDVPCPVNCKDNLCVQENGQCEDCNDGFYGLFCYACSAGCRTLVCDKTTGYCSRCNNGFYGGFCTLSCSSNCNDSTCSQYSGDCDECVSGYHSSTCNQLCPTNCKDGICVQHDGLCLGCNQGYHGDVCTQVCPLHCKDNTCIQENGLCDECDSGYYGTGCDKICPSNCQHALCDRSTGECLECAVGTYGELCLLDCSTQCKGGTCGRLNGYCDDCEAGSFGIYCEVACPDFCSSVGCEKETGLCIGCTPGYFGHNCQETCGQCSGVSCDMKDGACGCIAGWEGDTCNTRTPVSTEDHTWKYAGGGIGAVVVITLVIIIAVIVLRRRREVSYTKNPPEMNASDNTEMTPVMVSKQPINHQPKPKPPSKPATDKDESAYSNTNDMAIKIDEEVAYNNVGVTGVSIQEMRSIIDSKMANNALAFQEEFKTFPMGAVYPYDAGKKPSNKARNRFKNTLPYDHSRVMLETINGNIDSGYINANYIDSIDKTSIYIASQGPKPITRDDFWRMVWQVNSGKVVMLTNLVEGRKTKCHKYWPDEGEPLDTHTFKLKLERERTYAFYVIRNISIFYKKTKQERQVTQFHFTTWPDHGTPDTLELVLFHRRVTSYRTHLTGQMVVHCSAGIGRTGTFIGLDALLTHWKKTEQIDIPGYLRTMRKGRMDMVQTYKQYIALHELLVEGFSLQDTLISRTNFRGNLSKLCPKDKPANQTKMFQEFEVLQKCNPKFTASYFMAALKKENKDKNRDLDILAADMFRPFLQSQLPNRTDYINAVMIQSYTSKSGYLMTQFPLEDTVDDFWAMVCDYSCTNIIIIGQPSTEHWLQDDTNAAKRRAFSVKKLQEVSTNSDVTVNDYQLLGLRSSSATTVRIFTMTKWSSNSSSPSSDSSLLQLLEQLDRRRRSDNTIPVVVTCRDGCTQSGLFCCISNIRDQMKMDEEVDIFQTANQLKKRRPEVIGNVKQYQYCYDILGQYVDSTDVYVN
ncbi:receptor-type tyrosine-protein phosphatase kappa-like isoform X2 [Mizuhopecten yessoensis]|uniref:receptor-type tyrosine-protein phosphatase kappa-like isoform X2 n=1 Tax=Mizuhopecten yessoensis TaxID=6573 RepID=UPI000B45F40B|nr:receptor-type tyrosine-protein phosphatase kappa-like isoform X2 [Mizuhopecten yessoensis]